MKTKMLILAALALQIGIFLFVAIQAPEVDGAIQVGMNRLKDEASLQAPSVQNRTDGTMELKTAGDFFYIARAQAQIVFGATVWTNLISIVILTVTLISSRNKVKTVETARDGINAS